VTLRPPRTSIRAALAFPLRLRARACFVALLAWMLHASAAFADERILSFDAVLTVNADNSADIRETIRVHSEGRLIRRGIYRAFRSPSDPGHRVNPSEPGYEFRSVRRDGQPEGSFTRVENGTLRLYMGRADSELASGEHTYEIAYHVTKPVALRADRDELYWNITGNEWEFPVDKVSAKVILPAAVPRDSVRLEGYTGRYGSRGRDFALLTEEAAPTFETTRQLSAGEGFTLYLSWPTGFIRPDVERPDSTPGAYNVETVRPTAAPARGEDLSRWFMLGGVGFLLGYALYVRLRFGRKLAPDDPAVAHLMPPRLSPGCMRYAEKGHYSSRCFAADLLSLASKGYLRIDEQESGARYVLVRQTDATHAEPLSAPESALLAALFEEDARIELNENGAARLLGAKNVHEGAVIALFGVEFFDVPLRYRLAGLRGPMPARRTVLAQIQRLRASLPSDDRNVATALALDLLQSKKIARFVGHVEATKAPAPTFHEEPVIHEQPTTPQMWSWEREAHEREVQQRRSERERARERERDWGSSSRAGSASSSRDNSSGRSSGGGSGSSGGGGW
jgi:uncharacterized membrane protein YgcG